MQEGQINPQVTYDPTFRGSILRRVRQIRFLIRNRRREWRTFLGNPITITGLVIIGVYGFLALAQPLLMSTIWQKSIYDPFTGFDVEFTPHPSLPSSTHWLGTDSRGRDVLSQLALATRTSFGVGLVAALVGTTIATVVGMSAAYFGGILDTLLMTLADTFILLHPAVVLLTVGLIFEMSWLQVGVIYGILAGLGSFAMVMKAHTLTVKNKQYTMAARIAGGGSGRVLRVHILPNMLSLITVNMMFIVTGSVMIEALLAFLDRTQIPLSWGTMIWQTQENFRSAAVGLQWHVLIPPALSIMLFCSAFSMVARTLDKVVNPRLRDR